MKKINKCIAYVACFFAGLGFFTLMLTFPISAARSDKPEEVAKAATQAVGATIKPLTEVMKSKSTNK